jgi:hypothetical protein
MVERICSQCQYGNPVENRFCGRCGTNLEHPHIVPQQQQETHLAPRAPMMPVQWKQVGKAMAVSLAALAAEAGMAWLRRRVDRMNAQTHVVRHMPSTSSTPSATQPTSIIPKMTRPSPSAIIPSQAGRAVTIWSQRIVQTWERGELTRETIERSVWRRED